MPREKVPGRDRIDLKATAEFVDMIDRAAKRMGLGFSNYIRLAIAERLQRDGFIPPEGEPLAKPRGRPRKEK
jgi:hypothetical protein